MTSIPLRSIERSYLLPPVTTEYGSEIARRPTDGGPHSRLPGLDALRGIAILLVILHHSVQVVPFPRGQHIAAAGWVGVDLFFVLSGFLITGILLDARHDPKYFRNFYMRRVLRIFPLYYGVLAASLLSVLAVPRLRHFLPLHPWLWSYCTNIKIALVNEFPFHLGRIQLDHFWSLAVEEHFYLIWPVLVWALDQRALKWVCLLVLAISPCVRLMVTAPGHTLAAYVLTPCRMDALAAGALVAIVVRQYGVARLRAAGAGVTLAALAATAILYVRTDHLSRASELTAVVGFSVLAILFSGVALLAAGVRPQSAFGKAFCCRPLIVFGKYSYGLYVFHLVPRSIIPHEWLVSHLPRGGVAALTYLCVETVASLAIAFASWHLYEKHFLKLKRSFEYRPGLLPRGTRPVRASFPSVSLTTSRPAELSATFYRI